LSWTSFDSRGGSRRGSLGCVSYFSGCDCRFSCRGERREQSSRRCFHGAPNASFLATDAALRRTRAWYYGGSSPGHCSPLHTVSRRNEHQLQGTQVCIARFFSCAIRCERVPSKPSSISGVSGSRRASAQRRIPPRRPQAFYIRGATSLSDEQCVLRAMSTWQRLNTPCRSIRRIER